MAALNEEELIKRHDAMMDVMCEVFGTDPMPKVKLPVSFEFDGWRWEYGRVYRGALCCCEIDGVTGFDSSEHAYYAGLQAVTEAAERRRATETKKRRHIAERESKKPEGTRLADLTSRVHSSYAARRAKKLEQAKEAKEGERDY